MTIRAIHTGQSAVAPLAGAWIEIMMTDIVTLAGSSLPSRERGLKYILPVYNRYSLASLPSRERGLKSKGDVVRLAASRSLPSRERGLKSRDFCGEAERR